MPEILIGGRRYDCRNAEGHPGGGDKRGRSAAGFGAGHNPFARHQVRREDGCQLLVIVKHLGGKVAKRCSQPYGECLDLPTSAEFHSVHLTFTVEHVQSLPAPSAPTFMHTRRRIQAHVHTTARTHTRALAHAHT